MLRNKLTVDKIFVNVVELMVKKNKMTRSVHPADTD